MTTPEERREAHIQMMLPSLPTLQERMAVETAYGSLTGALAETEPALADAIRFGLREVVPVGGYGGEVELTKPTNHHPNDLKEYYDDFDGACYQVDYPEGHEKR